tara:strand:- start:1570 stop:1707 length:138 start_codon:yes stop_codon:yes gene_type:complete
MNNKQYLQLWLSEQIPVSEWLRLLDENPKLEKLYRNHLKIKNVDV